MFLIKLLLLPVRLALRLITMLGSFILSPLLVLLIIGGLVWWYGLR